MNIDDYEKKFQAVYDEFAKTVKAILEKAIAAEAGQATPQFIQCRAKQVASLRKRLEATGLIESPQIEKDRKDLAGVRLIFYTNIDVERFLDARLIPRNFEVDHDATKIHHPTKENRGTRYQAIHYVVSLSEARTNLPEYSKFKGLRCEIQIQTILNHAWSETSHDITYKGRLTGGFGTKAMEAINNRLNQIMDKYLLPAGYDFQRVQYDYERLLQGKELFDRDAIQLVRDAKNNNERFERLSALKDYVIPNYDDIPGVYQDIRGSLIAAVSAAVQTPRQVLKTPFGEAEGNTVADVAGLVVDIFEQLRFVDVEATFSALCEMYRDVDDRDIRKKLVDAVERLSRYDLEVWKQVGPQVQSLLVTCIDRMLPEERVSVRDIVTTAWGEILNAEISGTTWKANSVTLSRGALPFSTELQKIRQQAINGLFDLFTRSESEDQRRAVLSALRRAVHAPTVGEYSPEFLKLTLSDATRIVEFLAKYALGQPYLFLEHIEHELLYDYYRAKELAIDEADRFGCRKEAGELVRSIETLRDRVNSDGQFVKYKTLVGFESVFPLQWENAQFNYEEVEAYRSTKSAEFVADVTEQTEDDWYSLIEICAATKSNDLATFPQFGKFLVDLAREKPEIAERYLSRATENLNSFLPAFLNGMYESPAKEIYNRTVSKCVRAGANLAGVARHWRHSKPPQADVIKTVLSKAIAATDAFTVIECVALAIEAHGTDSVPCTTEFFVPAIKYLTAQGDVRWINGAWYLDAAKAFFASLSVDEIGLVLENLLLVAKIDHRAERLISLIANAHLEPVWRYLGNRLSRQVNDTQASSSGFEPIPYHLHGLEKALSRDVALAVSTARGWYSKKKELFRFRGGRLLSSVFPEFPSAFGEALSKLVNNGSKDDAEFVLEILENYHGEEATHAVLKDLVVRFATDDTKLAGVKISFDSTGVVSGESGFVDAYRAKKAAMQSWLDDPRPQVRAFATDHIRELDVQIAAEQRRTDQRREMRKREFEEDEDSE